MRVFKALFCLIAAGCTVDPVADDQVFPCDPAHTDPNDFNSDCGEGFACYSAAASLGFSFCTKKCSGTCDAPGYECSGAGGCLKRCNPFAADPGCPRELRCISTSTSGGACVPVAGTCNKHEDCTSTVFNACFGFGDYTVGSGPPDGGAPLTSFCLQSGCVSNGTACAPGSSCIRKLLPPQISAPDICAPDCNHDGECPPNMICAAHALPASNTRICIPDFYGFPCAGAYSCVSGECSTLIDPPVPQKMGAKLPPLSVCADDCDANNDCPDVSTTSPDPYSIQACRHAKCESLFGLSTSLTCFTPGKGCGGDGTCQNVKLPSAPLPDGGVSPCPETGTSNGPPPFCARECAADADCAQMEVALGRPLSCVKRKDLEQLGYFSTGLYAFFAFGDPPHDSLCVPRVPGLPCTDKSSLCLPGLSCLPVTFPGTGIHNICTKDCSASGNRCDTDDGGFNLGPGFACGSAIAPNVLDKYCYPKIVSGQRSPHPALCMSGATGPDPRNPMLEICVSPPQTACEDDLQCKSRRCLKMPACNPHGRCQ